MHGLRSKKKFAESKNPNNKLPFISDFRASLFFASFDLINFLLTKWFCHTWHHPSFSKYLGRFVLKIFFTCSKSVSEEKKFFWFFGFFLSFKAIWAGKSPHHLTCSKSVSGKNNFFSNFRKFSGKFFCFEGQHMGQKMKALDEPIILMYHNPTLIMDSGVTYPRNSEGVACHPPRPPWLNSKWPPLSIPPPLYQIGEMQNPPNLT